MLTGGEMAGIDGVGFSYMKATTWGKVLPITWGLARQDRGQGRLSNEFEWYWWPAT